MRARHWLTVSLLLNLVLLAAGLWWRSRPAPAPRTERVPELEIVSTGQVVRIVKTNIVLRPRAFTWREIESLDYATYVANLRAVGCPESTVRDIIVADVSDLFARRRNALLASRDFPWWKTQPQPGPFELPAETALALEDEKGRLLTQLLGADWNARNLELARDAMPLTGPVLSALPAATKEAVQRITAEASQRVREHLLEQDSRSEVMDEELLNRIREQTREQLARILTATQLEEYLLRYSHNAAQLRTDLANMEVTPAEFRSLFREIDPLAREMQRAMASDGDSSQLMAFDLKRGNVFDRVLGTERGSRLKGVYTTEDVTAPPAPSLSAPSARALGELQQARLEEQRRINADPSLNAAQRQQRLTEIAAAEAAAQAQVLREPPPLPPTPPGAVSGFSHTVAPGETLAHVALRWGVRMSAIREANPSFDFSRLQPGVSLNIPTPSRPLPLVR